MSPVQSPPLQRGLSQSYEDLSTFCTPIQPYSVEGAGGTQNARYQRTAVQAHAAACSVTNITWTSQKPHRNREHALQTASRAITDRCHSQTSLARLSLSERLLQISPESKIRRERRRVGVMHRSVRSEQTRSSVSPSLSTQGPTMTRIIALAHISSATKQRTPTARSRQRTQRSSDPSPHPRDLWFAKAQKAVPTSALTVAI